MEKPSQLEPLARDQRKTMCNDNMGEERGGVQGLGGETGGKETTGET